MSAEPYINEITRKMCESYEQRNFGVRFSGHGSSFIPQRPICNKTFEDAKKEAIAWIGEDFPTIGAEAKKIIKQIKTHGEFVENIYFAGGEPLLMEEHYEILKYLIEKTRNIYHS